MSSRYPRAWMWTQACEMLEQAERMQRRVFRLANACPAGSVWEPPIDVFETESDISVIVALPGIAAEQIIVEFVAAVLVIAGERMPPRELRNAAIHRFEIPYGRFERRLELPPGRYEVMKREFRNGELTLVLRKA